MRIAIIGAGVAGLACAHRLEQIGFNGTIDIFEERREIGSGNIFLEFTAELFHRPLQDIFAYYAERYKLYLQPLNTSYLSLNYGPTRAAQIQGFQGHTVARGNHPLALERQLYEQIKSKVHFNRRVQLDDVRSDYDAIVLATGNIADLPSPVTVRVDRYAHFIHGILRGKFNTRMNKFWLNYDYTPKGYAYLLPLDEGRAQISLVSPDREYLQNIGWPKFQREVFGGHMELESLHEVKNLAIGEPSQMRLGNVIFTGNAAGAITPAMGFGLHVAILTGLHAAEAIAYNIDYDQVMKHHLDEYRWSLALRKTLEALNPHQLDLLIDGMNSFLGRRMIRHGSVNFLRFAGRALSMLQRESKEQVIPGHLPHYDGRTVFDHSLQPESPHTS